MRARFPLFLFVLAATIAPVSSAAPPERGAGDLTIHVVGSVNAVRGAHVSFTGVANFSGLLTQDTGLTPMQVLGDIRGGQTLEQIVGSNADRTNALALDCVLNTREGTSRCIASGEIVGVGGTAVVSVLEPRPDGRVVFDIHFERAFCRACGQG